MKFPKFSCQNKIDAGSAPLTLFNKILCLTSGRQNHWSLLNCWPDSATDGVGLESSGHPTCALINLQHKYNFGSAAHQQKGKVRKHRKVTCGFQNILVQCSGGTWSFRASRIRIRHYFHTSRKKSRKPVLWLLYDFLSSKTDVQMNLQ